MKMTKEEKEVYELIEARERIADLGPQIIKTLILAREELRNSGSTNMALQVGQIDRVLCAAVGVCYNTHTKDELEKAIKKSVGGL